MGRAPCCDKANVKKGPWSPEEDTKLKSYIEQNGTGGNWIALPQKIGLKRCGKSCRLRWLNYLRPNIKHGGFSEEEDNIICSLYISIGSRWSIIASQLPGRTDNDIKNYWNTRLKKKLLGKQRREQQQQARRANNNKQEIKKENNYTDNQEFISINPDDQVMMMMINQNPYWPELNPVVPPPYQQSLDPHFFQNLMIKLEGDDHQRLNPNDFDVSLDHHKLYENSSSISNMLSSPTSINSGGTQQNVLIGSSSVTLNANMFQGLENFAVEGAGIKGMVYENQVVEGFYGMEVAAGTGGSAAASSSVESSSWGDINSFVNYSTMVNSEYEANCQKTVPLESVFDDDHNRYFGRQ